MVSIKHFLFTLIASMGLANSQDKIYSIDNLPGDLLTTVLHGVIEDERDWASLSLVCKKWNTTLKTKHRWNLAAKLVDGYRQRLNSFPENEKFYLTQYKHIFDLLHITTDPFKKCLEGIDPLESVLFEILRNSEWGSKPFQEAWHLIHFYQNLTIFCKEPHLIYLGEMADGLCHGRGIQSYKFDEEFSYTFIGNFQGGKKNGKGKMFNTESGDVLYEGDFLHDETTGQGKCILLGYLVFEGEFINLKPTKGKITWNSGMSYEGECRGTLMHGKGEMIFENGNIYKGDFVEGFLKGVGTITIPGKWIYEGEVDYDTAHGHGKKVWTEEKQIHEGYFQKGNFTGIGKITLSDGTIYEGYFPQGFTGNGRKTDSNGIVQEGYFIEERLYASFPYNKHHFENVSLVCPNSGYGRVLFPNGDVYDGHFAAGKPCGLGELIHPDGTKKIGVFFDGKYQKNLHYKKPPPKDPKSTSRDGCHIF